MIRYTSSTLYLFIAIISVGFFSNTHGQYSKEPFSQIGVAVSYQQNSNTNYFHDFWSPGKAFQFDVETPFYAGYFFINSRYTSFTSNHETARAFDNLQIAVGWGARYQVINNVYVGASLAPVFSVALFEGKMNSRQKEIVFWNFASSGNESEIGFLFDVNLSYKISSRTGIRFIWSRSVI